jgi:hypothetical protein
MPILSYFTAVGSTLVTLLMLADVTLEKSARLLNGSNAVGLPQLWRPPAENSQGVFQAEKKLDSVRRRASPS